MNQLTSASPRYKRDKNKFFAGVLSALPAVFNSLATKISLAKQIKKERHSLRHLSDYQLRDIGLSREEVNKEINRGFLDIPSSRYSFGCMRNPNQRIRRLPRD